MPDQSGKPANRARREADAELREKRNYVGLYAVLLALIAAIAFPLAFAQFAGAWPWVGAGFGALLLVSAFGVWRAAEWARVAGGILLVLGAITASWLLLRNGDSGEGQKLARALDKVILFAPGVWLLMPSTRREFQRVREVALRIHRRAA
ncbi:MAG: hypothetical protein NTY35_03455 [Planctomycetota bacterium]|nr:hypothetical protein [Planctomycetota bacterium]